MQNHWHLSGLMLGILLSALALPRGGRAAPPPREITVFAAASLTDAFNALKPEFERAVPGVTLRFSFASSSALRLQLEQGAPADVFASADYQQMRPLADKGLVLAPRTFARNRLVVVIPAANPGKLRSVRDLARPGLRLVTTAAAVPIGRYTQEMLEKLSRTRGFPTDFGPRVNANVVSREANVRAALVKVELGEADAAVVYETDARSSPRVRSLPIPARANITAEYPVAVVAATPRRRDAEAFARFLLSDRGRAVLKRFGFR
jgi:molybdate transport system substrate-binding protein